jgi:nucleotide-binding universal stress UspA family protein
MCSAGVITMRQSSRIVVGYDGSAGAGIAVDWAAAEAARRDATLSLVHAVHLPQLSMGAAADSAVVGTWAVDAATVVTGTAVDRARQMGATALVTTETTATTAARALVDASQDASLVVLGTRGRGTTAGEIFGSVGVAVAAEAACRVVAVRGDPRPPGRERGVVVGVDGSPGSEIALRYAADLAAAHAASLSVVTAWRRGPGCVRWHRWRSCSAWSWIGKRGVRRVARRRRRPAWQPACSRPRDAHCSVSRRGGSRRLTMTLVPGASGHGVTSLGGAEGGRPILTRSRSTGGSGCPGCCWQRRVARVRRGLWPSGSERPSGLVT